MPLDAPGLTVVLAAFNEEESFSTTCQEILGVLDTLGVVTELLVVDDGSSDRTGQFADAIAARDARVRVIHHAPNLGLGGVYRTGFGEARGDYVTFFPADGQFPATIIELFLPHMADHDLVLGVLPHRQGSVLGKLLSFGERLMYAALFGRMPKFQGILMFRRSLLAHYNLRSTGRGWAVLLEFILRAARDGSRLTNVETTVRPRAHGASKVNNLRTIWSNFRQMLQLRRVL